MSRFVMLGLTPLLLLLPPPGAAQETPPPVHLRYDFTRPSGRIALPDAVVEASGLTLSPDGERLLVHGDERGLVLGLDPATGRETARFAVGRGAVENDFEGIAAVGPRLFLLSSTGLLYEFREPERGGTARYRLTDTGLGRRCEAEGLEHDPVDDVLLVACKTVAAPGGTAWIHRIPMAPWDPAPGPVRVALAGLSAFGVPPRLHPSAVAVDPMSSTLLLLAAREGLLMEVERSGAIRSVVLLPHGRHPQAEGLAMSADGTLYLVDEGQGRGPAHLTWYAPLPSTRPSPGSEGRP